MLAGTPGSTYSYYATEAAGDYSRASAQCDSSLRITCTTIKHPRGDHPSTTGSCVPGLTWANTLTKARMVTWLGRARHGARHAVRHPGAASCFGEVPQALALCGKTHPQPAPVRHKLGLVRKDGSLNPPQT